MTRSLSDIQPVLGRLAEHPETRAPLAALAREAAHSPFHFQRTFRAHTGETPKQYGQRLRLERAAALLLTTDQSILGVALDSGFESHEVFLRAFKRKFSLTPSAYRARGFTAAASPADHTAAIRASGPCIGLYHYRPRTTLHMSYAIEKKNQTPQPVLYVRRRVAREQIANTIGEALGLVFAYAQQHGVALSGHPLTRYPEVGPGMVTLEPSMRIASAAGLAPGGDVQIQTLPGGPAAVTMHLGPYESLHEAYAALEVWIEGQGLVPSDAPWEDYITDPATTPNPSEWRTQVVWPVRPR
ncbi:MAG: AraC family transcriptional regulator [Longimicrobiales bacterium]